MTKMDYYWKNWYIHPSLGYIECTVLSLVFIFLVSLLITSIYNLFLFPKLHSFSTNKIILYLQDRMIEPTSSDSKSSTKASSPKMTNSTAPVATSRQNNSPNAPPSHPIPPLATNLSPSLSPLPQHAPARVSNSSRGSMFSSSSSTSTRSGNGTKEAINKKVSLLSQISKSTKVLCVLSVFFSVLQVSYFLTHMLLIVFLDIIINCGPRSLVIIPISIQKILVFLFYIRRLYFSFEETIFEINKRFVIIFSFFYAFVILIGAISYIYASFTIVTLHSGARCSHIVLRFIIAPLTGLDIICNALLCGLFVHKLRQVES